MFPPDAMPRLYNSHFLELSKALMTFRLEGPIH